MMTDKDPSDSLGEPIPTEEPTALITLHLDIAGKDASDVRLKWDVDPRVSFSDRQELIIAGLAAITKNLGKIVNS